MAIYVYGATAQAKMTIDLLEKLKVDVAACVDKSLLLDTVLGYPVLLNHQPDLNSSYILAIRNAGLRKRTFDDLAISNYATLIDPEASISVHTEIEEGTVIFAKTVVSPDVQIGRQVLIDACSVIHSNTIIEDFVNIGANVSIGSNVLIGEGAEIGANAVIGDEVTIPPFTTVPAHSVFS
ncbi:hypothetical protein [Sphingobacterium sp. LRF_L2]|uniref:hypothetical protein n=1 Tax=Sphingobacterium sp. LRF_L2 TaxID=3369421 RepID=UPI003F64646E